MCGEILARRNYEYIVQLCVRGALIWMSAAKEDEKKGFIWFTLKMITRKKRKKDFRTTEVAEPNAAALQESRQPVTMTPTAIAQQPQSEPMKKNSKEIERQTENPKADKSDKDMNTSTKFVMVKAKMRPALTKMRSRNIMSGGVQVPNVEKKSEPNEEAAAASVQMGPGNVALRLPVEEIHLDEDETLQQMLYEHHQIDEENNAMKKKFREIKRQLRKQLDEFDQETGRLYDLVKSSATKPSIEQQATGTKDVSTRSSPNLAPVPTKVQATTATPAAVPIKTQQAGPPVAPPKNPLLVAYPQVTYKRTFHVVKGQMVPRYIPDLPPKIKSEKEKK